MKLVTIKTHESVSFGRKAHNHFYASSVPNRPLVELTLKKDINCVEVKDDKECVLIPLVNIAFMVADSASVQEIEEKKAEERRRLDENIKAKKDTVKRPK